MELFHTGRVPGQRVIIQRVKQVVIRGGPEDPAIRALREWDLRSSRPEVREKVIEPDKIRGTLWQRAKEALDYANPIKSNFHVGAAALVKDKSGGDWILKGWNNESENYDSIHAEESLVAKLGPGEVILKAVILGQNMMPLAPCGNCREVLLSRADPAAEVLVGIEPGKNVWMLIRDLLPSDFGQIATLAELEPIQRKLITMAYDKLDRAYTPYSGKPKGASILTSKGEIFSASPREDAAYHHEHHIEVALGMVDAARQREIERIAVISDANGELPFVPCGRCRQKLYEASQVAEKDFEVIMANPNGNVWITTVSQLLPYTFGPKDLGIDVAKYR